ncbi:HNH endonuclease signature motif containing protein [Sphingomonas sp. SAFR-052]|uniref:HNH endonuclease signature motif containing protein n=1 Tax=Sphingomonas sp. SAFR-052 TaxID=3436867 RepID=UPI003F816BFC
MCTIAIDVASRCWVWTGGISRQGYGRVKVRGRDYKAHRFSWETFKGPIPDNLTIDHLCKNKACVNPDHLEPVTSRENILRSDGASAVNARKTHCNAGHPFSGDNLYMLRGNRICRECGRVSARNYQRRKRGAAKCK